MRDDVWIDLTDPDAAALKAAIPVELHRTAFQRLLATPRHDDDPRPRLEAHGDYLFGVLVVPLFRPEEGHVAYQEIDLLATRDRLVTVCKTPPGATAYSVAAAKATACTHQVSSGRQLCHHVAELHFDDAHHKLLRATDGLDHSRDLLAGVRDYHQAQVANDQNEVMKRLTVVASVLLLPTFIVGLYGMNVKGAPELRWSHGYLFSWALIVVTTLFQLWYFRR